MKENKLKKEILEELRHEIQMYFYNAEYPKAYSDEEIQKHEKEVDKIMKIVDQRIDTIYQEGKEEFKERIRKWAEEEKQKRIQFIGKHVATIYDCEDEKERQAFTDHALLRDLLNFLKDNQKTNE